MLSWIIQISVISFVLIFLIHHLFNFFKTTLTVPKIKDLVNSPNQKYENIFDIIKNNSNSSSNLNISNNSNNSNTFTNNYSLIDLLPKTDIEQSVGRILREKHSNPIVVDIVDSHDLFKKQWKKRKTFYKKENYKIIYTTSIQYTPDTSKWTILFNPILSGKKECKPKVSNKSTSIRSNSSSDKSITQDSESEQEDEKKPKDKYLCGKCLLTSKKSNS